MHPNAQYVFNYIKEAVKDRQKVATLKAAWDKMKQTLTEFFKTSDTSAWQWGTFHQDAMHHLPFSNSSLGFLYDRAFEGFGNMHTVNVGKMNKVEFGNFETSHRANYRAVYSFAEDSYWIIDSGISEKFFSSKPYPIQNTTTTSGTSSEETNSCPSVLFPMSRAINLPSCDWCIIGI